MSTGDLRAAVATVVAAVDDLIACDADLSTAAELVEVLDELETLGCRLPAVRHRLLARLQVETTRSRWVPRTGKTSWRSVGASRIRKPTAG
ncbi:hypothetical protein EU78_00475 [Mycolicibacterium rufum]|nr:hypothetical protein EU78_00475 [Mycolicibacterium rufum]